MREPSIKDLDTINQLKKLLINKNSTRLSGFEFKSENIIKSKAANLEIYGISCKRNTADENSSVGFYQTAQSVARKRLIFWEKKDCTILIMSLQMNKIINKCLLNGNKFKPELHLKQLGFTYSACEQLTKHRQRI